MGKMIIKSMGDFLSLQGKHIGQSNWIDIDQNLINTFADATYDHQWIHIDEERAIKESIFGTTIAHGYLTLSLLPHLLEDIISVSNLKLLVNYGIEKMVFKSVVPVNSRLRLKLDLASARDLGAMCKVIFHCTFEIEGQSQPVLDGNIIYLYYFE